ncbi:MAG: NUDIX domain-containing protein [Candidatus Sericytochromatia bacterium]|nr:NUDIX domain-containing protein [Candidatus Sericytochromatia bacterium]
MNPASLVGPISTVGALALDLSGRALIVKTHKWKDTWGVPGGKIEHGERLEEALTREFLEETGLVIRDVQFISVYEAIASEEFYKPDIHMLLFNFVCRCDGGDVTLSDEAQEYRWVTLDEAFALPLNSFTRALFHATNQAGYFAHLDAPAAKKPLP